MTGKGRSMFRVKGRAGKNIRGMASVDGLDELVSALKRAGADVERALGDAAVAGAEVIKAAANGMAPDPINDIEIEQVTKKRFQVAIGPIKEKWYYRFFELGATQHEISGKGVLAFEDAGDEIMVTRVVVPGVPAQPFLRPAFDSKQQKAVEAIGKKLRKAVES